LGDEEDLMHKAMG